MFSRRCSPMKCSPTNLRACSLTSDSPTCPRGAPELSCGRLPKVCSPIAGVLAHKMSAGVPAHGVPPMVLQATCFAGVLNQEVLPNLFSVVYQPLECCSPIVLRACSLTRNSAGGVAGWFALGAPQPVLPDCSCAHSWGASQFVLLGCS